MGIIFHGFASLQGGVVVVVFSGHHRAGSASREALSTAISQKSAGFGVRGSSDKKQDTLPGAGEVSATSGLSWTEPPTRVGTLA